MPYNLSLINGTGVLPFLQTVDENLMFGWYGEGVLITLFIIILLGFITQTNDVKRSFFFTSSFIGIFSVFFRSMSLVSDEAVLIAWVAFAISAALLFLIPD